MNVFVGFPADAISEGLASLHEYSNRTIEICRSLRPISSCVEEKSSLTNEAEVAKATRRTTIQNADQDAETPAFQHIEGTPSQSTRDLDPECDGNALLESTIMTTKPVSWEEVIGVGTAKSPMKEFIIVPLMFPDSPQALNMQKGLLLFGVSDSNFTFNFFLSTCTGCTSP